MKVKVNLNLPEDFLLTCEVLHISFAESLMCYAENVKLFEVTHNENDTQEFKASQLFFCFYTYWCMTQNPQRNIKNYKLVMRMIDKVKSLKEKAGLVLNSEAYEKLIDELFKKLSLNYDTERTNIRTSK